MTGKAGTAFDHQIFDVDDVQLRNQILYFDDINTNENKIKGLAGPTEDGEATNKKFVDAEIAELPGPETDLLKLDGSRAMTGNLGLNNNKIKNIAPAEDFTNAVNLQQVIDIYHPYVYELNKFQFCNGRNIKINPINVYIRPDLPPDNVLRKHDYPVVYITNFFPGCDVGNGIVSYFHSFRNLNLDAGDYTFILEILTEYPKLNYNKDNVYLNSNDLFFSKGLSLTKNDHQYVDNEYNKVVLQSTSNGVTDGEIKFKFWKDTTKTRDAILVLLN